VLNIAALLERIETPIIMLIRFLFRAGHTSFRVITTGIRKNKIECGREKKFVFTRKTIHLYSRKKVAEGWTPGCHYLARSIRLFRTKHFIGPTSIRKKHSMKLTLPMKGKRKAYTDHFKERRGFKTPQKAL